MARQITLSETDRDLARHVKNGYMRYRDFKPLTQGGEAMLQTCYDENLGRTVVMKTLLPQLANLEVYRRRFLREARVTAQIPHPATVPVYEISRDREGSVYFTMKKLGGRDLCDILDHIAEGHQETIGRLRGLLAARTADGVVLDVAGVGYEISMTPRDMAALPGLGEEVVLHTHLHVREDVMALYGFDGESSRDLFRILLGRAVWVPRLRW